MPFASECKEKNEWSKGAKDTSRKEIEELKKTEKLARKAESKALLESEEKSIKKTQSARIKHDLASIARAPGSSVFGRTAAAAVPTKKPAAGSSASAGKKTPKDSSPADSAPSASSSQPPLCDDHDGADGGELTDEQRKDLVHTLTLAALDRHPERRAQAAWLLFSDREMPRMREEYPNVRRSTVRIYILIHFLF